MPSTTTKCLGFKYQPRLSLQISMNSKPRALGSALLTA